MRRRTVLIPVLTLATLTSAFSWWLWREMPLQPVRRIVLPFPPSIGRIRVSDNDRFCHLTNYRLLCSIGARDWEFVINLVTEEAILSPGALHSTELRLSKSRPWAYLRASRGIHKSADDDQDCYALNLNTWDWHSIPTGIESSDDDPFTSDTPNYEDDETPAKRWRVAPDLGRTEFPSWMTRLVPDHITNFGWANSVTDTATDANIGYIWSHLPTEPYPSDTGLIWLVDIEGDESQTVIKAYNPRVRPVQFWLWAVTAMCVASVAIATFWGRGRRK